MTINSVNDNGTYRIELSGRIDSVSCDLLRDEVIKAVALAAKEIIIDLENVDYISTAGLRAIFVGHKAAAAKDKHLILVNAKPAVQDILRVTGFDNILDIR